MRYLLPLAFLAIAAAPAGQVDPARLSDTAKTLGSAPFEGRSPGTPGEKKTLDYLVGRFKAMGMEPGGPGGPGGQWLQKVPMIRTKLGAGSVMIGGMPLQQQVDLALTTVRPAERIAIKDAPLVFVGYGVHAPEAGWDDFKGIDLHGKVAVFLVNDPDFAAQPGDGAVGKFGGRRMTYYGRWTYKFEEAARQGAIAALIVHDTDAAGYGWTTVAAGGGENYDIVRGADDPRIALQGWISHDKADALFRAAGLDLSTLRKQARQADFKPVPMGKLTLSTALPVSVQHIESANVLAKLTGTSHPQEIVMFGAHWDAYGLGTPDAQGRTMRPGANDDGMGVAGVLELARLFRAAPRTQRTTVFALWTGEERGLLGSEYYGTHPVYSLATTVANLTMDILQTAGPARNVVLVGKGASSLDADLAQAAAAQGRTIVPETFSERGLFYRADHFSLAKHGVPAMLLMALGGPPDLKQGGTAAGQAWLDAYMKCYHQTCDQWSPDWDLRGAAQDVDLFYAIGRKLADSRAWPSWSSGSEFSAIRTKSDGERK